MVNSLARLEVGKRSLAFLILLLMTAYSLAVWYLSYLRFESFLTLNWDLGIPMQALWSTNHGFLLFETGDYTFFGVHSYLQIHSTYVALIVSQVYKWFPSAGFLLALQTAAIALCTIPLYLISREINSNRLSFLIILLFLLNFLVLAANFWDFHWESLLPLEFFSMFYLIQKGKYWFSLIPFLAGISTMEVFPFLSIGILLYFAFDRFGIDFLNVPKMFKRKDWLWLFSFFTLSIISYLIIRAIQYLIVPHLLGVAGSSGDLSTSVKNLFILHFQLGTMGSVAIYWLVLYASFGFISLLFPKHLILGAPWMFFTILLNNGYASSFGFQYSYIAILPVATGALFALNRIESRIKTLKRSSSLLGIVVFSCASLGFSIAFSRKIVSSNIIYSLFFILLIAGLNLSIYIDFLKGRILKVRLPKPFEFIRKWTAGKSHLSWILIVLICLNLIISPINPNNSGASQSPGYRLSFSPNPEYPFLEKMISIIPQNATIVASDNLFPYVANDVNAYSLTWFSPTKYKTLVPFFPFNASNLPPFVLVDSAQFYLVPPFLTNVIFNRTIYGLVSCTYDVTHFPGSIYLFERNYSNRTHYYYVSSASRVYYFYGKDLSIGASGQIVSNSLSKFGVSINSKPASNPSGNNASIWYGPYYTFAPGEYQITISLKGNLSNQSGGGARSILFMNSNSVGSPYYYSYYVHADQLSNTTWTKLSFKITITEPYPGTEFRGYLIYSGKSPVGQVELNYIEVALIQSFR